VSSAQTHRQYQAVRAAWQPRVLSLLRIMAGLLFLEHGTGKLFAFPATPLQPAMFQFLWFAAVIETLGGLLLTVGLFTRIAAFIMSGEMAVGYFTAHAPRSFFPALNGGDAAILFCLLFFYFFVAGPGPWSLDAVRSKD
jgi:putative oxidoreductase